MNTTWKSVCGGFRLALLLGVLFSPGSPVILAAETTVYVNNHFEVRGHDQSVKYIFNNDTRIARVTGSLSANTRVQRLRLRPGWNSASLAVTAQNALGQLTNSQPATVSSVFEWDQSSQTWRSVQPNETLSAGTVLWLHATTNATVALTGTYADPTNQPIATGSAFLPNAGLEATSLLGLRSNVALSVFAPADQRWLLRQPGIPHADSSFPEFLAPGSAIFVQTDAQVELETPDPALRIRYYHTDHLGSSSVITDAAGELVEETAYYPFGVPRNEERLRQIENGDYRFTQKERDPESGLSHFGSRFLSSGLARFTSVDTLAADMPADWLGQPQKLNIYAYVGNNPLAFVDPTGMDREKPGQAKPTQAQPNHALVMYGESQFADWRKMTGNSSRAAFENAMRATYKDEAGAGARIDVKRLHLTKKSDLKDMFRGSSYDVVVYNGHASSKKKELIPGGSVTITPDDLRDAMAGATKVPSKFFTYGCNSAQSGFARLASERMPNMTVTGASTRIAPNYEWDLGPKGARRNFRVLEDRTHNITFEKGKETRNVRTVSPKDLANAPIR